MASQPPPAPSGSPRSPPRKRRSGAYTRRTITASGPCPRIADHYPPVLIQQHPHTQLIALQALAAFQRDAERRRAITGTIPIILDTGASVSVTNCCGDFKRPPHPVQSTTLQGIAAGLVVKGVGTSSYTVLDDAGQPVTLEIPGTLYVPECPSHLLCPRQLLSTDTSGKSACTITQHGIHLTLQGHQVTARYQAPHHLPILTTAPTILSYQAFCHDAESQLAATSKPQSASPFAPLTLAQQIKLQWHQRFLVPRRGLEPPHLAALVPETSASTNSATWAGASARSAKAAKITFAAPACQRPGAPMR